MTVEAAQHPVTALRKFSKNSRGRISIYVFISVAKTSSVDGDSAVMAKSNGTKGGGNVPVLAPSVEANIVVKMVRAIRAKSERTKHVESLETTGASAEVPFTSVKAKFGLGTGKLNQAFFCHFYENF